MAPSPLRTGNEPVAGLGAGGSQAVLSALRSLQVINQLRNYRAPLSHLHRLVQDTNFSMTSCRRIWQRHVRIVVAAGKQKLFRNTLGYHVMYTTLYKTLTSCIKSRRHVWQPDLRTAVTAGKLSAADTAVNQTRHPSVIHTNFCKSLALSIDSHTHVVWQPNARIVSAAVCGQLQKCSVHQVTLLVSAAPPQRAFLSSITLFLFAREDQIDGARVSSCSGRSKRSARSHASLPNDICLTWKCPSKTTRGRNQIPTAPSAAATNVSLLLM